MESFECELHYYCSACGKSVPVSKCPYNSFEEYLEKLNNDTILCKECFTMGTKE